MRVRFNWSSGATSLLQNDQPARIEIDGILSQSSLILVDGEQVWPRLPQDEQVEAVPFPIGMRVQVTRELSGGPPAWSFGRVVQVRENTIGVEWESWDAGHECQGSAVLGRGYYTMPSDLVAAPLPQTTTPTYPDCETECGSCGSALGMCISEGEVHAEDCLDTMREGDDRRFYHDGCQPNEEEETPPPSFQIGDEVVVIRGVGSLEVGHFGTVRLIDGPNRVGVAVHGLEIGNTLGGLLASDCGFYCTNDMLERNPYGG